MTIQSLNRQSAAGTVETADTAFEWAVVAALQRPLILVAGQQVADDEPVRLSVLGLSADIAGTTRRSEIVVSLPAAELARLISETELFAELRRVVQMADDNATLLAALAPDATDVTIERDGDGRIVAITERPTS